MHDASHDPVHIPGGSPSSPRTEWEAARAAKTSASNRNSRRRGKNKKDKTEEKFVSKVRDTTVDGVQTTPLSQVTVAAPEGQSKRAMYCPSDSDEG